MSDIRSAPKVVRDAWLNDKAKHARLSSKGGKASRKRKVATVKSPSAKPARSDEYYERARQIAAARGLHD